MINKKIFGGAIIALLLAEIIFLSGMIRAQTIINTGTNKIKLQLPLSHALERVTVKPFGLYITPKNSPIKPERFRGYHTGVDFETLPAEKNIDVPIYAICTGKIVLKKIALGYGGVVVQKCILGKQPITVIYGHMKLASIKTKVGKNLTAGSFLGSLGKGYSKETDNERKHLHLAIHKGISINIRGYVSKKSELNNWLNPLDHFNKIE